MKQWIKFSTEVHRDRKMWQLSKDAQLTFFYLLSIAGRDDKDGILPSLHELSLELWFLKFKKNALELVLSELKNAGIIEEKNDVLRLKNFHKWQISEKTKSEINHENYLKRKSKLSEIQTEFRKNSDEIQTENNLNSDFSDSEIQKNSDEIQTLEKEIEIDIEKEKEKEKEKKKKEKKENFGAEAPHTHKRDRGELMPFGTVQNVFLSEDEYQKLQDKLGKDLADDQIEELSLYMAQNEKNAKKYTDHYFTVLKWSKNKQEQEPKKSESWADVASQVQQEISQSYWSFLGNGHGEVIDYDDD